MTSSKDKNLKIIELLYKINHLHWFHKENYHQNPVLLDALNKLGTDKDFKLEIRIAITTQNEQINSRFLTYFIPALELQSLFNQNKNNGVFLGNINLKIILNQHLTNFVAETQDNQQEYFDARKNLIQAFIRKFYPKIIKSVKIEVDDFDYSGLESSLSLTEDNKSEIHSHNYFQKLIQFATKREHLNPIESALKYALSHTLLFGDFITHKTENKPNAIITIGGPAEKYFNYFREFFSSQLDLENYYKPLQIRLIQNNGISPPYYNYSQDLSESDIDLAKIDETIKHSKTHFPLDFQTISNSIMTNFSLSNYFIFFKQHFLKQI